MAQNFSKETFEADVQKKNLLGLRSIVVSIIEFDPAFSSGDYEYVIDRLRKDVPEVFVEYKLLPNEEPFREDENSWNEKYFLDLTFYLQKNFCEERIVNIRKVGQKVYEQRKANAAQRAKSEQRKIEAEENFIHPPKTKRVQSARKNGKKDTLPLGKIVLALVAIAGILLAVFQNFQN